MNTPLTPGDQMAGNDYSQRWLLMFALMISGCHPLATFPPARTSGADHSGERGAVSLEQVLWFVAAGLSVAVIAGILWAQIRTQASTPINVPSAP
jgi:hypothetical protein